MTSLTIPLTDEQAFRLEELARQASVSASDVAFVGLHDWLNRPRHEF